MSKGKELLRNLKFYDSYSKYREDLNRKETWEESVEDVMKMHYNKFKDNKEIQPYLNFAKQSYKDLKVLASQRNLQYREEQILRANSRLFNCASTYIDRPEVFKQIMYVLLCGCGMGYSVEKRFIEKLPQLKPRSEETITYQVEDSIEGWALALDKLIQSFFEGSEQIRFDGSLVRPEGAFISGGFKAPGYEPLKKSLELIEKILQEKVNNKEYKLSSLDCHEIICISSDAVLSAGVRRSALICLFDKDDELMLNCKTGDWFYKKPWLARSNNSLKLIKGEFTKEEFNYFKDKIKEFGEPGAFLVDDKDFNTNPCQPDFATIIIKDKGLSTFKNLKIGDEIWSKQGWTKVLNKWSTGIKPVFDFRTTSGVFTGTSNHRVETPAGKIEVDEAESILTIEGEYNDYNSSDLQSVIDGMFFGDGYFKCREKYDKCYPLLVIGKDDYDYFDSEIKGFIKNKFQESDSREEFEVDTTIIREEKPRSFELRIPKRFFSNKTKLASFLRGLYTADGSVIKNKGNSCRVTYKTASKGLAEDVQLALSYLGIKSYITVNKAKKVIFDNGEYLCKESYDVNISTDRIKFKDSIGFVQKYKMEKLSNNIGEVLNRDMYTSVKEKTYIGDFEVFDITVDNDSHTYWTGGLSVSNCGEIGFIPRNRKTGNSCISFCNLTEINGGLCTTEDRFYEACKAASILGTLQASYTNMPFLGKDTQELIEDEALIGVSITGIMENPKILLNAEILRKGAEIVNKTNEEVAAIIGINPAARTTTVKPSGNASVLLKTMSGVHASHSKNYFRIMQMNKGTEMAEFLNQYNPVLLEDSVWSASGNDYAVYVPVEEKEGSITKDNLTDTEFAEHVKTIYQNWVLPGTMKGRGYSDRVTHNVSNTITVQDWDRIFDYIYDNQEYFCGLSFLAETGDKVYKQAPFTKVMDFEELVDVYGEGVVFASGLIIDALHAFGGDLWDACEAAKSKQFQLTGDRVTVLVKKDIVQRIKKFSRNYYKGNIEKTVECLKDVHLFHKWKSVQREFKTIDFTTLEMKPTYTNVSDLGGVACSGGACELTF